jgi:hypothetical protein
VARFDVEVWKARATARFNRATEAGKPDAATRFMRDIKAIDDMTVIVSWCERKKIEVVFDRNPNGAIEGKRVRVNGRTRPEHQLYILVHECGHHLIGTRERDERYGWGYNADEPHEKRTLLHRVDVVDEEFEAWDRGRKLAARLGVKLDKEAFQRARASYLKTYMQWALKVDGYGGPINGSEEEADDQA